MFVLKKNSKQKEAPMNIITTVTPSSHPKSIIESINETIKISGVILTKYHAAFFNPFDAFS